MRPEKIGLLRRRNRRSAVIEAKDRNSSNWQDWSKQLAVIAGAIWVLYLYLQHEREQRTLSNESLRIANEQAARITVTEVDLKKTALEQQRMTLRMSEIAAQAESERSRLALEQQRLAVDAAKSSASVHLQRERLALGILELDRGLKYSELRDATNSKIAVTPVMKVRCDADGRFLVSYDVVVSNTSEKKAVEISWELRSVFVGLPISPPRPIDGVAVLRLNEPPDPYTGSASDSPISWQPVGNVGYVYPGSKAIAQLRSTAFEFREGGLLTKVLQPKDKSASTTEYDVAAPPGSWISVVLRIGIDGETSGGGVFRFANWEKLNQCQAKASSPAVVR